MPGSSNSSFIPKRNPVKKSRKATSRRIYTVTLVSYILMFSTLVAAAGMFMYKEYIERQLEKEIEALDDEISRFDNSDLQQVKDFDARLQLAAERVENNVSVASLFSAFEAATIGTVSFEKLSLERDLDDDMTVEAGIRTDSFDSSIFQRGILTSSGVAADVAIDNLQKSNQGISGDNSNQFVTQVDDVVTFDATIAVGLDTILYDPSIHQQVPTAPIEPVIPVSQTGTSTNVTDL